MNFSSTIEKQKKYFSEGKTTSLEFRINSLKKLKKSIINNKDNIINALHKDLHKAELESYFTELILTKDIDYFIEKLPEWNKPKLVDIQIDVQPCFAYQLAVPKGVVLIISPWNLPFNLSFQPLIGSIAAGNCSIVKPSEKSSNSSSIIKSILDEAFEPEYITTIEGDSNTVEELLEFKFEHIFYTGNSRAGRDILKAASQHLTPVTLELGGKCPCIVSKCDIELSAKRIAWGKFINAGQTCLAPDYILVSRQNKNKLIEQLIIQFNTFLEEENSISKYFCRIIDDENFYRLKDLLNYGEIVYGGVTNNELRYISPTIIVNPTKESPLMEEEIFGPILPLIEYEDLSEAIDFINTKNSPLSIYLFSNIDNEHRAVINGTQSGSVCINDTIIQGSIRGLPFGGVNESGMGAYHGRASFDTFSHYKSIVKKPFFSDFLLSLRYPPYSGKQWISDLFSRSL